MENFLSEDWVKLCISIILRRSRTFTPKKVGLRNNEQIRVLGLA